MPNECLTFVLLLLAMLKVQLCILLALVDLAVLVKYSFSHLLACKPRVVIYVYTYMCGVCVFSVLSYDKPFSTCFSHFNHDCTFVVYICL